MGLPIDLFDAYKKDIDALVNRRNSIAHGNSMAGVSEKEFSKWEQKVSSLWDAVTRRIYEYVNHKKYLAKQ